MSFAEAEQTDGAESFASDISWTYSLDLVDSLKPPHSFPLWDLKDMFFHMGWKRKQWPEKRPTKRDGCGGESEENAHGPVSALLIIQWISPQIMLHFYNVMLVKTSDRPHNMLTNVSLVLFFRKVKTGLVLFH